MSREAPAFDTDTQNWDLSSLDIPPSENKPADENKNQSESNNIFDFDKLEDFDFSSEDFTAESSESIENKPVQDAGGLDSSLFDFDTAEPAVAESLQEDDSSKEVDDASLDEVFESDDVAPAETNEAMPEDNAEPKESRWKWAFEAEEKELQENADSTVDLDSYGADMPEDATHTNIWLDNSEEEEKDREVSLSDENPAQEWEYEEVPAEEAAPQDEADAQDWEWEYEEVPAEEAAPQDEAEAQDWEWEYEEVPAEEAAPQESADAQDWEWEYEEVPAEDIDPYSPNLANEEASLLTDIKTDILFNQQDVSNPATPMGNKATTNLDLPPVIPALLGEENASGDPYQTNSDVK